MNVTAHMVARSFPHAALPTADDMTSQLEAFRFAWWQNRSFGLPLAKLPPLSNAEAEQARKDAFDHYYRPCGHADLSVSAKLRSDTMAAIDAAVCEHEALNRRRPKVARIRDRLRERDGNDCWVCKSELGDDCTIEHKVARANGGTWAFDNLALAHRECNLALGRLPLAVKEAARAAAGDRINAELKEGW